MGLFCPVGLQKMRLSLKVLEMLARVAQSLIDTAEYHRRWMDG